MGSWFAGRVALPRPLETLKESGTQGTLGAEGVLGVRVKEERIVGRGAVEAGGLDAAEERGVTADEVEMEEQRLEEEGEDLLVPLAWFSLWLWFWLRLRY